MKDDELQLGDRVSTIEDVISYAKTGSMASQWAVDRISTVKDGIRYRIAGGGHDYRRGELVKSEDVKGEAISFLCQRLT